MLNRVSIQGRLVSTPELRHSTSDIAVTTFTLAVGRSYVKKGEERLTDFVDVVAWRSIAEFICRNFSKGQMIIVTGAIQTRTYTGDDGKNRKVTEVVADNAYFCDAKKKDQDVEESDDDWLD